MEYEAVIGMEVHAQIITASKMFCGCSADYAAAPPNTHTCPVCLGMPGVLPVANEAAIEATVLTGLALGCEAPAFSKFDRKNYPYPDLPKGYQISQYDYPLCVGGRLDVQVGGETHRIGIRRVHLEEDTAKLVHAEGGSLIDYNRAGVPLMEIVTEADMRSAEDAYEYLTKLRTILRYLGVNSGNMEEGAMRCEANVSVRPKGASEYGVKVEVKNLNSFRSVRLAIAYEIERQTRLIERGERVRQVTMGWDEERLCTVFQRSKEFAEDYRYFPEPDLPPLEPSRAWVESLRSRLPELPDAKRERFIAALGIKAEDAALLTADRAVADYVDAAVVAGRGVVEPQTIANWMVVEVLRLVRDSQADVARLALQPNALVGLLKMVGSGAITQTVGKEVLAEAFASGEAPEQIVERRGLRQISDADALRQAVVEAIVQNPKPLQQYLEGKQSVFAFFVGQVMRATRGKANPQVVAQLLQEELAKRAD